VAAVVDPASIGPAATITVMQPPAIGGAQPQPIVELMAGELARSLAELAHHGDPALFASYEVTDGRRISVSASLGAITSSSDYRHRWLDVDVRVGTNQLDNTHRTRGERGHPNTLSAQLPLDDDAYAIRSILWLETDDAYKRSAEQLSKVQANTKLRVKEEDDSDDFSRETASQFFEPPAEVMLDRPAWEARLRVLSLPFRDHPEILSSSVTLTADANTRYFTSSEATRYQLPQTHLRVTVQASTTADDGMELHRYESFDVAATGRLPTDDQIRARVELVIKDLLALRAAPVADPYTGPAILDGKAASVFFHEVFGHRIEGHRQKDEAEGQTFAKKIGQRIAPAFITVYDDPTIAVLDGVELNGFYRYDDEGVPAQRASLIDRGVLSTFLLGRSPTRGIVHSNGHGRRQEGFSVVARQGNLVVAPAHTVPRAVLEERLLAEVKRQGKPYGLVFSELDGGHTGTSRFSAQAFKLLPIMVYRIYPDGRRELVRGADLEGTPLTALGDIAAAGDDVETFNGYCGAESGFVPVSSSSPSLLIGHVEVTKKAKGHDKPPILPAPPIGGAP
jgi:TldD protein